MTKREEIREGINMKSPIPQAINRAFLQLLKDYRTYLSQTEVLSSNFITLDEYFARGITGLLIDLHSQGVVIKVERELPSVVSEFGNYKLGGQVRSEMLEAGYEATEPLIEERGE